MKALVFVGAFNPPTVAHIDSAYHALIETGFDVVVFVPSKSTYIKVDQGKDSCYTEEERLGFLNLLASTRPWMRVSDLELKQKDQPRTYLTLKKISEDYDHVSLLFGSDKLPELETGWKYVDEIGKEFGFVLLTRNHDPIETYMKDPYLEERRSYFTFISPLEEDQHISSTIVRKRIREHQSLAGYVPEELIPLLKGEKE